MTAGPDDLGAGRQIVADVHGSRDEASLLLEVDLARGDLLRRRPAVRRVTGELGLRSDADRGELELVDLDGRVVATVGVLALVLGVETGHSRVHRRERPVDRDRERAPLAEVAHRDVALERHLRLRHAFVTQELARLALEPLELRLHLGRIHVGRPPEEHLGEIVADVDQEATERRRDTGVRRYEHRRDRELPSERRAVERAGSAEDDEGELARVVAAPDGDEAHGIGHVRVGDLDDGARSLGGVEPERPDDVLLDRLGRGLGVEGHRADERRAEPSEHDVRVRVGRLRPAAPVARRPGVGARRLRPVVQRAGLVDPGERAATGADRQHLDGREADRVAVLDVPLLRRAQLAVVDERDVGRGAAHVEPDGVPEAARRRDVASGDRARRDAGAGEPESEPGRRPWRHHAAARVQKEQVSVVAAFGQPLAEAADVAADEGREDGVRDRGREALVLEDLRQHLARRGHGHAGQLLLEELAHPLLVLGVGVGVDEADGHRLDLAAAQDPGDAPRVGLVQRLDDVAAVVDTLAHLEAVAAAHVRRRDVLVGVPEVFLRPAPDLDHVAEPRRRHHRDLRETAREERVRGHRRAVREEADLVQVDAGGADAVEHGLHRVMGRRRNLRDPRARARLLEDEDVGERAAHVDRDTQSIGFRCSFHGGDLPPAHPLPAIVESEKIERES